MPNGTFKDLILVMNSIAVTTGGTRAKFEKFGGGGQKVICQVQGTLHKKLKKKSFLVLRRGPTGTQTESLFCYIGDRMSGLLLETLTKTKFFLCFTLGPIC